MRHVEILFGPLPVESHWNRKSSGARRTPSLRGGRTCQGQARRARTPCQRHPAAKRQ